MNTNLATVITAFTLEEAAEVCGLNPQVLRNWVSGGHITPAIRGSTGRTHRFSCQQLLGLASIGALIRSERGCSRSYARELMARFEAITDAALADWMGGRADTCTEEGSAAWASIPEDTPVLGARNSAALPSDVETERDIERRHRRVKDAIRARLGLAAPSAADRPRAGSGKATAAPAPAPTTGK
jgi:DNA-binding transcriptional MerR regulator